ncbi:MAG TPA: signal peptidase II [Tahibacter sp.]|nr:signal peptidase II [Tahibacter sp.]
MSAVANRVRPNALIWLVLSAVIIALDQWTKQIALAHLVEGMPQPVIPGVLNWTLAFNTGAAFSFLADAGGWQRWGFGVLALGVSSLLAVWLARTPRGDWPTAVPLALVIGGALGNMIDRLLHGHVVDFIQTYYWAGKEFPAFNVADSAISVGAVMMIVVSLFGGKDGQGAR